MPRQIVPAAVSILVVTAIVLFGLSKLINFGSGPRQTTLYYIDDHNVYYSPPLIFDDPRPFAFAMMAEDAIDDGYSALDMKIETAMGANPIVYVVPSKMKWVLKNDSRGHLLVSTITREELTTIEGRRPDEVHRDSGGFQDWCGPFCWALRSVGVSKPRWSESGDWNW